MSDDEKRKNWDPYLRGVSTANVKVTNGSWLKRPSDKAGVARKDAFAESPTPLAEREDSKRRG